MGGAGYADTFEPCATFQGARPGWYFSTNNKATGYYKDTGRLVNPSTQKPPTLTPVHYRKTSPSGCVGADFCLCNVPDFRVRIVGLVS